MSENYYLELKGDTIHVKNVGPVVDLTGIESGLEASIVEHYGDGDQAWDARYKGTLKKDDEGYYVTSTYQGRDGNTHTKVFRLSISDIVRGIAWQDVTVKAPMEREFIDSWVDCFHTYDRGAHTCPNFDIHQKNPYRHFRGFMR